MIKQIHVHQKVKKEIKLTAPYDNASGNAAVKAENIIQSLQKGIPPARAGLLSRKKDLRIKNLYKFNLGRGYRLISIKEKDKVFVLFFGTHDQCDRWLDDNRKKNPHQKPLPTVSYAVEHVEDRKRPITSPQHSDETLKQYDDPHQISQKELRRIFCGLAGK